MQLTDGMEHWGDKPLPTTRRPQPADQLPHLDRRAEVPHHRLATVSGSEPNSIEER